MTEPSAEEWAVIYQKVGYWTRAFSRRLPRYSAEELVSVAYEGVHSALVKFDPAGGSSLLNWVNMKIKYALMEWFDREATCWGRLDAGFTPFDEKGIGASPWQRAEAQLDAHRLLPHLLSALPERTQTILRMYYAEEQTQDAIAEELGLTGSRVNQIIRRALVTLRQRANSARPAALPLPNEPADAIAARLPDYQRALLEWLHIGATADDISRWVNKPSSTVRRHCRVAVAALEQARRGHERGTAA